MKTDINIKNINIEMLRDQRDHLVSIANQDAKNGHPDNHIDGIINMMDAMLDVAEQYPEYATKQEIAGQQCLELLDRKHKVLTKMSTRVAFLEDTIESVIGMLGDEWGETTEVQTLREALDEPKGEENTKITNHYFCPECKNEWLDQSDSETDDDCPECGQRHISPWKSK